MYIAHKFKMFLGTGICEHNSFCIGVSETSSQLPMSSQYTQLWRRGTEKGYIASVHCPLGGSDLRLPPAL